MLFRKSVLFAAAAILLGCSASAAHAQLGLYATVTGERVSGIKCVDPQGLCASIDGTIKPYGATFGGYYEFRNYGPARVGFDLRGSVTNTNKPADYYQASTDAIRHYTALGGVRAAFTTPFRFLRPYAQVDAGYARTNAVAQARTVVAPLSVENPSLDYRNYTQVQGVAGLDIPLFRNLDLRAIEFTAGALFGPSTHGTQSIGVGLVFHSSR